MSISQQDSALLEQARAAAKHAYVPYSNFRVGAAVSTMDGTVITGCNVENASYGLTICAERTAMVKAVSQGHHSFDTIAIWVEGPQGQPCGACRQFLLEFGADLRVVLIVDGEPVVQTLAQLLPNAFVPETLNR